MESNLGYISELVVRTQNGDNNAFAELYTITYSKVYNYARHYMREEFLAQDALQEIYIKALKNINNLRDPSLFIAWLNQISFRVCYDLTKAEHTADTEVNSELLEEVVGTSDSDNPEGTNIKADEIRRLRASMDLLPETDREVIVLRFFRDMKIDDIAKLTGLSRSTVKRKLAQSVETLKRLMEGGK